MENLLHFKYSLKLEQIRPKHLVDDMPDGVLLEGLLKCEPGAGFSLEKEIARTILDKQENGDVFRSNNRIKNILEWTNAEIVVKFLPFWDKHARINVAYKLDVNVGLVQTYFFHLLEISDVDLRDPVFEDDEV